MNNSITSSHNLSLCHTHTRTHTHALSLSLSLSLSLVYLWTKNNKISDAYVSESGNDMATNIRSQLVVVVVVIVAAQLFNLSFSFPKNNCWKCTQMNSCFTDVTGRARPRRHTIENTTKISLNISFKSAT